MNVDAINTTISLLADIPPEFERGFNMENFAVAASGRYSGRYETNVEHPYQTVSCIAGWVAI